MSAVFYLLVLILAFGGCYAVYRLGVASVRLIRWRVVASECRIPNRPQYRRRPF